MQSFIVSGFYSAFFCFWAVEGCGWGWFWFCGLSSATFALYSVLSWKYLSKACGKNLGIRKQNRLMEKYNRFAIANPRPNQSHATSCVQNKIKANIRPMEKSFIFLFTKRKILFRPSSTLVYMTLFWKYSNWVFLLFTSYTILTLP